MRRTPNLSRKMNLSGMNNAYALRFSRQAQKDEERLAANGLSRKAKAIVELLKTNPYQNPPRTKNFQATWRGIIRAASTANTVLFTRLTKNAVWSALSACGRITNKTMNDRFARTRLLLGDDALARLNNAYVTVVGLRAVGSYVVEGLARVDVGRLRLVDFDRVAKMLFVDNPAKLFKIEIL